MSAFKLLGRMNLKNGVRRITRVLEGGTKLERERLMMSSDSALVLRVSLLDTDVWRTLIVPGDLPLKKLHIALQCVMGWEDAHQHAFFRGREEVPARTTLEALLPRVGSKLTYVYDFGDDWCHEIRLEKKLPQSSPDGTVPACLDGAQAAPPEDCGGVPGYFELVRCRLEGAKSEEDIERMDWLGDGWDPRVFDCEAANARLRKRFRMPAAKKAAESHAKPAFTDKQGQYLAFIFWYTRVNRVPPAQSDIAVFFGVSGPAVAGMIATLDSNGLIERRAGQARSLRVLVSESALPPLQEPGSPMLPPVPTWVKR